MALIVRDEEASLPRLLDSIGWTEDAEQGSLTIDGGIVRDDAPIDYVVVCDTGSTDRTVEIAHERGCRVVTFDWIDDFSAARQASWDAIPQGFEWLTWADADDVIVGVENLRALAANSPPQVAGYLMPYDYARDDAGNCLCYLERERLIRRSAPQRWVLPVHEIGRAHV